MNNKTETMAFSPQEIKREHVKLVLKKVKEALEERGYNSINQITGYLISNDPAYISSYKNARTLMTEIERNEIIEELVRYYLEEK